MGQVDFYQIGQAGLELVLLMLLKKTLAKKQKALVLCPMPAASAINAALWTHDPESWIPHGLDDAKGASYCDVWVSSDMMGNPINAEFLFLLHGSAPKLITEFKRCFCLFDGKSDAQLQQARDQWKEWQQIADTTLGYYAQNSEGGWDKKS
ncbi:DNA polymerase III subunit chi [Candidatus Puniceispirillum sp.]|nr:DNA polymerase III subunit chi [Candidatus Puniceispirillum sp.]